MNMTGIPAGSTSTPLTEASAATRERLSAVLAELDILAPAEVRSR